MPTLLERFENDQRRRGLQPNTIVLRSRQLKLYSTTGDLERATADEIQEWLDGRNISDKTRSCYLTTFSAFYKWGVKYDFLALDPTLKIEWPKLHTGMPNPIPEKDLKRALDAIDASGSRDKPMLKCWIVLEAYAGLRCQEVAFLAVEDIQVAADRIYVRSGKGGEERYVSGIHPTILSALAEYEAPQSGRLWPFAKPANVSQRINRYYHGLGITHTAHKNRHRFGTRILAASGGNLITAQRALGHKDVSTTQIYAGIDDQQVRSAVLAI